MECWPPGLRMEPQIIGHVAATAPGACAYRAPGAAREILSGGKPLSKGAPRRGGVWKQGHGARGLLRKPWVACVPRTQTMRTGGDGRRGWPPPPAPWNEGSVLDGFVHSRQAVLGGQ